MEDSHIPTVAWVVLARVVEKGGLLHGQVLAAHLNYATVNSEAMPPVLHRQLREHRIEACTQHPPRLRHLRIGHPAKKRAEELARPVHPPRFHTKLDQPRNIWSSD